MQGSILFSLLFDGVVPWYLALPLVIKELTQGALSVAMLRRRRVHADSRWFGKVALCMFYATVIASILLRALIDREIASIITFVLWAITILMMMYAFVNYIVLYARMAAEIKKNSKGVADGGEI